jgi:hypothetical protein
MACGRNALLVLSVVAAGVLGSVAAACVPPERPFLPQSREDMRAYAELIREDFEGYFAEMQVYFRCIDVERARAFVQAHKVSQEYGRFLQAAE